MKPKESDWKTFRSIVPKLRERYLKERIPELSAILENGDLTPTERFWQTEKRIQKEAKILRNCLDGHKRSNLTRSMALMYRHKMLNDDDLLAFSETLQMCVRNLNTI